MPMWLAACLSAKASYSNQRGGQYTIQYMVSYLDGCAKQALLLTDAPLSSSDEEKSAVKLNALSSIGQKETDLPLLGLVASSFEWGPCKS